MRRFLIGFLYSTPDVQFGFGSTYLTRDDDSLPGPQSLLDAREHIAQSWDVPVKQIVIMALSEVSAEGPVVA